MPEVLSLILDGQKSAQGSFTRDAKALNKLVNQVTKPSETTPSFLKSKQTCQHKLVLGFLEHVLREGCSHWPCSFPLSQFLDLT